MSNPSKSKGTWAETRVAEYLAEVFPTVERRALNGSTDKGDIAGIPGVVVEVKNCARYDFPKWMAEAKVEQENARAAISVVVAKPKGIGETRVGEWWALVDLETLRRMLAAVVPAMYGRFQ